MRKYSRKRSIFSVSFLSLCFLTGLVFTDYYTMSEVDWFSSTLAFENQDLPTLSNLEKSKANLAPAETVLSLPVLNPLGHIDYLRAPISSDEKTIDCLRC